ncbi:conserved hypothetical protein [Microbacterium sp. 8M]|uniref:rhamnosyltransferase WsaF family glycosyltransferase n=1 Tax=Microbacterium sp. 8M TaxID=2653153 RepID=UPI0012F19C0D|nr:hypothetical protein [Microbacterium sp. 8M]VXB73231.1 conserved hypothetical protein [Microbacterium sp. 8M]
MNVKQIQYRAAKMLAQLQDSTRRRKLVTGIIAGAPTEESRLRMAVEAQLHWSGVMLCAVAVTERAPVRVNLVLPELRSSALFAGIDTALRASGFLANERKAPLRVVSLGNEMDAKGRRILETEVRRRAGLDPMNALELVGREALVGLEVNEADIWVPTHWTTAHAVGTAAGLTGALQVQNVVYLIQDYEPGFTPWSTDYALARATYHAGFHSVINSMPLARYLESAEKLEVPDEEVFRPGVHVPQGTPADRRPEKALRVAFYGRPSKPRNLFGLGVAVLQRVAQEVEQWDVEVEFVSAGEAHAPIALTEALVLRPVGRLSWDDYFRLIADSDVLLSLQHSPHPSHPPFDAVVRGCYAVTNEFGGIRNTLSPLIYAREPRVDELAGAIVAALRRVREDGRPAPDKDIVSKLGQPLENVMLMASQRVGMRPS